MVKQAGCPRVREKSWKSACKVSKLKFILLSRKLANFHCITHTKVMEIFISVMEKSWNFVHIKFWTPCQDSRHTSCFATVNWIITLLNKHRAIAIGVQITCHVCLCKTYFRQADVAQFSVINLAFSPVLSVKPSNSMQVIQLRTLTHIQKIYTLDVP